MLINLLFQCCIKMAKRVVKTWNLVLNYISPEDPYGENANTN